MDIKIKAYDEEGKLTCAKMMLCRADTAEAGRERTEPTEQIVYFDGEYFFAADAGVEYRIEVFKGKLYAPFRRIVSVAEGESVEMEARLERLVDPVKLGLYSFDAHSHVSRHEKLDTGNLTRASIVMMAEDFNFFYAGSPYDHATHLEYLRKRYDSSAPYREQFAEELEAVNRISDRFLLDIGNEFVKVRYGHMCILNFAQRPPFSQYYDEAWDPWNDSGRQGAEPPYELAYPYEAVREQREPDSFVFSAHPTSWWKSPDGVFITNIASTLAFDSLAGVTDGIVVMGYGIDRQSYQEVWFEALRNGHFLPGVAETDVAFDTVPNQKFLQYKTFAFLEEFSPEALGSAMRGGRNIVTSGPLLILTVNGQLPGAVLPYERGEAFDVAIEAFACHEAALSKVQLIVNGIVAAETALDGASYKGTQRIEVEEDSFVIAKCYDLAGNVALTSPVYIRNAPFVNRGYTSQVTVYASRSGEPASGVVWLDDDEDRREFTGTAEVRMSPASRLHIAVEGEVRTVKLFELDELQSISRNLYLGDFNQNGWYEQGDVPAAAFEFARVKQILDRVELKLEF